MNIDREYSDLLTQIIVNGDDRLDRTETGTRALFGVMSKHSMSEGFPLLTSKKVATKQVVSELLWFMRGQTDIKTLIEKKNNIWVGDAYKKYVRETKNMLINIMYGNTLQRENIENGFYIGIKEIKETNYSLIKDNFVHVEESEDKVRLFNRAEFIERVKQSDIKNDKLFYEMFVDLGKIYGKQWRNVTKNFDLLKYYKIYKDMAKSGSPYHEGLNNVVYDVYDHEQYVPLTFEEFYWHSQPDNDFMLTPSDFELPTVSFQTMVFGSKTKIDQLNDLVEGIKNNPYGRRHIVNAWNVSELHDMTLPPCHFAFQCFVRNLTIDEKAEMLANIDIPLRAKIVKFKNDIAYYIKEQDTKMIFFTNENYKKFVEEKSKEYNIKTQGLSLMWMQRSCDTALGKEHGMLN